jgi:hypothetical protein
MRTRKSSAIPAFIPASTIRAALGDALGKIRSEEGLTWAELGELIGKGDDQTTRYVDGSAEMGVTTFYRAKQLWNGRFTGVADRMAEEAREEMCGHQAQSAILKAALALSVALEDGKLTVEEVRANRATLENARDAIASQLSRLTPKAA